MSETPTEPPTIEAVMVLEEALAAADEDIEDEAPKLPLDPMDDPVFKAALADGAMRVMTSTPSVHAEVAMSTQEELAEIRAEVDRSLCGAHNKNGSLCRNIAGFKTNHLGEGKCFLHGGRGGRPVIHGMRSKRFTYNLMEQIEAARNDPELLTLNSEIAVLRVQLQRQIEIAAQRDQRLEDFFLELAEQGIDVTDPRFDLSTLPDPVSKSVDLELIKTLIAAVRNAADMQFSKRFSIPVRDVVALLQQMAVHFNAIADEYQLPAEAKLKFGNKIRSLKVGQPLGMADVQLARSGNSDPSQ